MPIMAFNAGAFFYLIDCANPNISDLTSATTMPTATPTNAATDLIKLLYY